MGIEILAVIDAVKFLVAEAFDLIGQALWPVLALIALIVLRKPLINLVGRVDEVDLPGAKVKLGNERASELKREAEENANIDLDTLDVRDRVDEPMPDTEPEADAPALDSERFIRYYWRIVDNRLRLSGYNTSTTSSRLAGEIVGNTYADLKQLLRVVGYFRGIGGNRGRLMRMDALIERLELPNDLRKDILWARRFAEDVTDKTVQVDGNGATDFITAVRLTAELVIRWAIDDGAGKTGPSPRGE